MQLLAPFSVGGGVKNKVEAADNCKFETVSYSPRQDARPNTITITLKTSGCVGELVKGVLTARHVTSTVNAVYLGTLGMLDGDVLEIPEQEVTSNYFSFRVETGENGCGVRALTKAESSESKCLTNYTFTLTSKTKKTELGTISSKDFLSNDALEPISFNCATANCNAPNQKTWKYLDKTDLGQTDNSGNTTITQNVWYFETTVNDKVGRTNFLTEALCNAANKTAKDNYNSSSNNGDTKTTIGDCQQGQLTQNTSDLETKPTSDDILPACSLNPFWGSGTVMGCVAQIFYYVLFVPTSYVFALAGTFFDFTFHYSVQDTSYRTPFVVEGWGIVRDMCNMFFIFILLYIAFSTILNIHGFKTKEMIINVVIIGLLINFSLFATQVMIDASNILARVFYNSDSIKITQNSSAGTAGLKIGPNGEIPLSAAVVNKVNPQNLIINGRKSVVIQDKVTNESSSSSSDKEGGLGVGAFILITLLATAVNIVGIITFLSVGLIFVARVIGLWFAMIFSPFVFFSYTVPSLQDMEMVGWKKWWPETLKLAFLAPVFIFFLYLIVAFLEKGLSLIKATDIKDGMTFVISIIVPFIFIMILLMKAKDIAKDMSGKLGQSITSGIAAVGGVALGGAALGGALLGRKVIGAGLAGASRTESSIHLATQKIEHNKKLEEWETNRKNGIAQGPKPVFVAPKHGDLIKDANGNVKKDAKGNDIKFNNKNPFTHIGAKLNEKQMKIGDVDLARHEMDETKKAAGLEGVGDSNLSGVNEKKLKDTFAKTKRSDTEANIRRGVDAKGKDLSLKDENGNIYKGEDAYKAANRNRITTEIGQTDPKSIDPNTGELTDEAKKRVENQLNVEFNAVLKTNTDEKLRSDFEKLRTESKQHVGGAERAFSRTNTGSWDVRKLSDVKSDKREGFLTKVPVALIAGIATGVRAGMKNVGVSNGGIKVEGNFMKDLGNTISDSLKSMKINADLSHVGETKSSADAHAGGAHH